MDSSSNRRFAYTARHIFSLSTLQCKKSDKQETSFRFETVNLSVCGCETCRRVQAKLEHKNIYGQNLTYLNLFKRIVSHFEWELYVVRASLEVMWEWDLVFRRNIFMETQML